MSKLLNSKIYQLTSIVLSLTFLTSLGLINQSIPTQALNYDYCADKEEEEEVEEEVVNLYDYDDKENTVTPENIVSIDNTPYSEGNQNTLFMGVGYEDDLDKYNQDIQKAANDFAKDFKFIENLEVSYLDEPVYLTIDAKGEKAYVRDGSQWHDLIDRLETEYYADNVNIIMNLEEYYNVGYYSSYNKEYQFYTIASGSKNEIRRIFAHHNAQHFGIKAMSFGGKDESIFTGPSLFLNLNNLEETASEAYNEINPPIGEVEGNNCNGELVQVFYPDRHNYIFSEHPLRPEGEISEDSPLYMTKEEVHQALTDGTLFNDMQKKVMNLNNKRYLQLKEKEFGENRSRDGQYGRRYFPETNKVIYGFISHRWETGGGLEVFGYPVSDVIFDHGGGENIQYFQRVRMEENVNNESPYEVLLGRLGAEILTKKGEDYTQNQEEKKDDNDCIYFEETKLNVCGDFKEYWESHGADLNTDEGNVQQMTPYQESLYLFGLPITTERTETLSDGKEHTVQWFERARMEKHGDQVLLGLLGCEAYGKNVPGCEN